MTNSSRDRGVPINSIVAKLMEEGERAVIVRGYVGPAEKGLCRVYGSLGLTNYVEFSESAIIQATEEPDSKDGRMRIVIGSSTHLEETEIRKRKLTASDLEIIPPITGGPYEWPYPIPKGEEPRGPVVWPPSRPSRRNCLNECQDQRHQCVSMATACYATGFCSLEEYMNAIAQCDLTLQRCRIACWRQIDDAIADIPRPT